MFWIQNILEFLGNDQQLWHLPLSLTALSHQGLFFSIILCVLPLQRQVTTGYKASSPSNKGVPALPLSNRYLWLFLLEKSGLVCATWDFTHVHSLCYEYDEQKQFSCCEAISSLHLEGEMGKKMAVSESAVWLRVKMEKLDTVVSVVTKTDRGNLNSCPFLSLTIKMQTQ